MNHCGFFASSGHYQLSFPLCLSNRYFCKLSYSERKRLGTHPKRGVCTVFSALAISALQECFNGRGFPSWAGRKEL